MGSYRRHGKCTTRAYKAWSGMLTRVRGGAGHKNKYWSDRNVQCHKDFLIFENFYAYMGDPPTKYHSLDRYPNKNGHYTYGNMRWATSLEQGRNKRNTILVTYKRKRVPLIDVIEALGFNYGTVTSRIYRKGQTATEALNYFLEKLR